MKQSLLTNIQTRNRFASPSSSTARSDASAFLNTGYTVPASLAATHLRHFEGRLAAFAVFDSHWISFRSKIQGLSLQAPADLPRPKSTRLLSSARANWRVSAPIVRTWSPAATSTIPFSSSSIL